MSKALDGSSELRGEILANVLYTRDGPGTSFQRCGQRTRGERVTIFAEERVGDEVWYNIGIGYWVHGSWVRTFRIEEGYET